MGVLSSDENELTSCTNSSFDEKVLNLNTNLKRLNTCDTDEPFKDNNAPINVMHISMQRHSEFNVGITSEESSTDAEFLASQAQTTREERVKMLQELLEIYFSDNYLSRDIFLLKHFRKSKKGWISFKFIASYKRIKRRTREISELIEAVENSTLLEFNKEKTKVRRTVALPSCIDEYIPTRMALVGGLPDTLRSLSSASKLLSPYGTVESLQLLRPGGILPELLQETAEAHPELREQWCLVVEYEDMHAAGKLVKAVNDKKCESGQPSWVLELVMPWRRRKQESLRVGELSSCYSSEQDSIVSSPQPTPDSSPSVRNHRQRGLTKRERMIAQSKSPVSSNTSSPGHQPKTSSYYLQSQNQLLNTNNNNNYYCPRRSSSDCNNWRTAPAF